MAQVIEFHINRAGFDYEFRSWPGTVGRYMAKVTTATRVAALGTAPKPGGPGHGRDKINYATGNLVSQIREAHGHHGVHRDLEGSVTSHAAHSMSVHEGTPPHVIRVKRAPALNFFWVKRGVIFHGPKVNHPGTPADQFLVKALEIAFRAMRL